MMADNMTTLAEFIATHKITIECVPVDSNPYRDDDRRAMNHYKCRLKRRFKGASRSLSVYFSMGLGLTGEPTTAMVLDSLASDASGCESAGSFDNWASEYGYDTDSRKAERTYRACLTNARKLKAFLGAEMYETLLYKVERE
jgi:hypothetical protein